MPKRTRGPNESLAETAFASPSGTPEAITLAGP
jgi:hypothetical protein